MLCVVIPVYNRADLLKDALGSLVAQSTQRFITVVVDDGSTEDIKAVVDQYDEKLQLVYLRQENAGPGAARDTGIEWAINHNMELIMFLDADDRLLANAVATLSYEINHSKAEVVASSICNTKPHHSNNLIPVDESLTWTHGKIYRVPALKRIGVRFTMGPRTNEDVFFNLVMRNLVDKDKFLKIDECTYMWQSNEGSITSPSVARNECLGWDYIRAVHDAVVFCLAYGRLDKQSFANVLICYNYYQLPLARGEELAPDIDSKIRFLYNLPEVKKLLRNSDIMASSYEYLKPYLVDHKHIYYFKETFGDFLKRFVQEDEADAHSIN